MCPPIRTCVQSGGGGGSRRSRSSGHGCKRRLIQNVPNFETTWKLNATTSRDQRECVVLSTSVLTVMSFSLGQTRTLARCCCPAGGATIE